MTGLDLKFRVKFVYHKYHIHVAYKLTLSLSSHTYYTLRNHAHIYMHTKHTYTAFIRGTVHSLRAHY